MADWAMDSSGLRAAHRSDALLRLGPGDQIVISMLTWLPVPAARAAAVSPALQFPASVNAPNPTQLTLAGTVEEERNPVVALCEALEGLHADGIVCYAHDDECDPRRVAEVEAMWRPAGLLSRPTDETISAVLTAERAGRPLVCADVSVRRLANHCGVSTVTVADFAAALAA